MGKDEKKSERHITDKVKPLTASIKQSTAKKARKCGNCGLIGHTRVDCVQPDNIPQKSSTASSVKQIQQLFK